MGSSSKPITQAEGPPDITSNSLFPGVFLYHPRIIWNNRSIDPNSNIGNSTKIARRLSKTRATFHTNSPLVSRCSHRCNAASWTEIWPYYTWFCLDRLYTCCHTLKIPSRMTNPYQVMIGPLLPLHLLMNIISTHLMFNQINFVIQNPQIFFPFYSIYIIHHIHYTYHRKPLILTKWMASFAIDLWNPVGQFGHQLVKTQWPLANQYHHWMADSAIELYKLDGWLRHWVMQTCLPARSPSW